VRDAAVVADAGGIAAGCVAEGVSAAGLCVVEGVAVAGCCVAEGVAVAGGCVAEGVAVAEGETFAEGETMSSLTEGVAAGCGTEWPAAEACNCVSTEAGAAGCFDMAGVAARGAAALASAAAVVTPPTIWLPRVTGSRRRTLRVDTLPIDIMMPARSVVSDSNDATTISDLKLTSGMTA